MASQEGQSSSCQHVWPNLHGSWCWSLINANTSCKHILHNQLSIHAHFICFYMHTCWVNLHLAQHTPYADQTCMQGLPPSPWDTEDGWRHDIFELLSMHYIYLYLYFTKNMHLALAKHALTCLHMHAFLGAWHDVYSLMYFTILHASDAAKNYMVVKLRLQAFF